MWAWGWEEAGLAKLAGGGPKHEHLWEVMLTPGYEGWVTMSWYPGDWNLIIAAELTGKEVPQMKLERQTDCAEPFKAP